MSRPRGCTWPATAPRGSRSRSDPESGDAPLRPSWQDSIRPVATDTWVVRPRGRFGAPAALGPSARRDGGAGSVPAPPSSGEHYDVAARALTQALNLLYFVLKSAGTDFRSALQVSAAWMIACVWAVEAVLAVPETHLPNASDRSAFVP